MTVAGSAIHFTLGAALGAVLLAMAMFDSKKQSILDRSRNHKPGIPGIPSSLYNIAALNSFSNIARK